MNVGGLRLPDFIIGGAPRAATTWLSALADLHPKIAMAKPVRPEPKFFLVDEIFARGAGYYSETWFTSLPAGRLIGEKSTNYLESPLTAARIAATVPDVRLVFLLRNPVDRAYSNYLWSKMNGLETETFERALELESGREAAVPGHLRYSRPHAYFSRGLYAEALTRFFQHFPRSHILIIRYEDVAAQPRDVAAEFHRFLGVDLHPEHADQLGRINAAQDLGGDEMSGELRSKLAQRYAEPNRRLAALLGPGFALWRG
jgi:Sulfotransferase domain